MTLPNKEQSDSLTVTTMTNKRKAQKINNSDEEMKKLSHPLFISTLFKFFMTIEKDSFKWA